MMTKPEPGQPILINIGERILELQFPLSELKALDREHGINILKGTGLGELMTDAEKLAVVFHRGLRTKQPDITQEWVENNVLASMLIQLAPLLMYAMSGNYPKMPGDEAEANPPRPASHSTGSPYGPSDVSISDLVRSNSGNSR